MSSTHAQDLHMVQPLQSSQVPIIDFSLLHQNSHTKSLVIQQIHEACQKMGFFHVINHGISESVIEGALDVNSKFFEMPLEIKEELKSDDIYKPVRFNIVRGDGQSNGQFLRDFLRLYAYPLEDFMAFWPKYPPNYRDKMGIYTVEVRNLGLEMIGTIMESLNLGPTYMRKNLEQGVHIMAANSYPPCSQSNINMGIPPHSDHSIITILLQSCPGFHLIDRVDGGWKAVPELKGSLQVLVGDHLEVLSNGMYKSVWHRAIPSSDESRVSIASFHSLEMDERVEPAVELLNDEQPKRYKGSSLKEFFIHLSSREEKSYIETLKI